MTEPNHSPGPWTAIEEDGKWLVVCDAYEDETPGICGDHSEGWPLFEEDARVLAAAPDMLAALLKAEAILKVDHPNGETISAVRNAIAKALSG